MNKTEHYQLNQWDKEDRILMEDFNRDNANIESAIATEAVSRQAADAELEAKMAPVRLCGAVSAGNVNQISLSVSGIDWSKYSLLILNAEIPSSAYCQITSGGNPCYQVPGTAWQTGGLLPYNYLKSASLLYPIAGRGSARAYSLSLTDRDFYFSSADTAIASVGAFYLKTSSSSAFLPAGAALTLWGVR